MRTSNVVSVKAGLAIYVSLVLMLLVTWPVAAVELYVMGGADGFRDDAAEWEALYPDIHLNYGARWQDDGLNKALVMIAAGTPPDLIRMNSWDVSHLMHLGILQDLSSYIAASTTISESNLSPIHGMYRFEGRLYALNKDWSADGTLYYNRQLCADAGISLLDPEVPLSYEELKVTARRLVEYFRGRYGETAAFYGFSASALPNVMQTMLVAAGEPVYSEDHAYALIDGRPEIREIAEYWVDMAQRGWLGVHKADIDIHNDFPGGKIGIVQQGYWFGAQPGVEAAGESLSMAPLASWKGQRANFSAAVSFGLVAQSRHKAEAWKALEWLVAGTPARNRAKSGWGLPPLRSLLPLVPTRTEFEKVRYQVTLNELPYIRPFAPNRYSQTAINGAWNSAFNKARKGEISIAQMVEQWQTAANASLAALIDQGKAK